MDSIGADALGAMWSETTLPCHTAGILLLFSDLLHQLLVGGALDDLVELGAVVPHEAHAADHDVARAPAVAAVDHQKSTGIAPWLAPTCVFTVASSPRTPSMASLTTTTFSPL